MKALGISMSTLEIMATRMLEWGRRGWREARDATWIHMDVIPSAPASTRVDRGFAGTAAVPLVGTSLHGRSSALLARWQQGDEVPRPEFGGGERSRTGPCRSRRVART